MGASGIARYVQSVSIGGTLFIFGFLLIFMGLLGDAIRANRMMLAEILVRLRENKASNGETPSEINGCPLLAKEDYASENKT